MRLISLGIALGAASLLAACGKAPPPPAPPANAITPGPIDYFDITQNKLYGGGCNFVADGGGMAAIVLAQEKEAIIKLEGKLVRIPADTGSQILPETARTRYSGPDHILILAPMPGAVPTVNGVIQTLPVSLAIVNPAGKQEFAAKGQVQCKPM